VSVNTAGFQGNERSDSPSLSTDGMLVAFESNTTNFYDSSGRMVGRKSK
jgi:hypothetical protein